MTNCVLCRNCRHFEAKIGELGFGSCNRWLTGYDVFICHMANNDVLVENDEGWGMVVGPDFGCVLGEPKDPAGPQLP